MIKFEELEKVAEYKNGKLDWLEGRDINAIYVILVGDEYYIGSSHYVYLRIGQHLYNLRSGNHHSYKLQKKFDKSKEFEVYVLERGIDKSTLQSKEYEYIERFKPTLNIIKGQSSKDICHEAGSNENESELVYKGSNGYPTTDSFKISKTFGITHDKVVKLIKTIIEDLVNTEGVCNGEIGFANGMFDPCFKNEIATNDNLYYTINRDGFEVLSSYLPKGNLRKKLLYMEAFSEEDSKIRGNLVCNINALTRKQLAQLIINIENEKEVLRQTIMEKDEELYELDLIINELRNS